MGRQLDLEDLLNNHNASMDALMRKPRYDYARPAPPPVDNSGEKNSPAVESGEKETLPLDTGSLQRNHPCHVCGAINAPFGVDFPRATKWLCRDHWEAYNMRIAAKEIERNDHA